MSQPQVWRLSGACEPHAALSTHAVSVRPQPIINVREGENSEGRVRERSPSQPRLSARCLRLRVFKSLSPLHTPQPCVRLSTRAEPEHWAERTRGMANRHGGGARGGGANSTTGRVSLLLDVLSSAIKDILPGGGPERNF